MDRERKEWTDRWASERLDEGKEEDRIVCTLVNDGMHFLKSPSRYLHTPSPDHTYCTWADGLIGQLTVSREPFLKPVSLNP